MTHETAFSADPSHQDFLTQSPFRSSEAILLEMLEYLSSLLGSLACKYHVEYEELRQEAALFLLEKGQVPSYVQDEKLYLKRAVEYHLLHTLRGDYHVTKSVQASLSLDAPLSDEGTTTLLDRLADTTGAPSTIDEPQQDFAALYASVEKLQGKNKETVIRYCGLYGQPSETFHEIAGCDHARSTAYGVVNVRWQRSVKVLHEHLSGAYPQYYSKEPFSRRKQVSASSEPIINQSQRERLDHAYAALQASGERVTRDRLRKVSGVDTTCAGSYLRRKQRECVA